MPTIADLLRIKPEEASSMASMASSRRAAGSKDPDDVLADRFGHFYEQGQGNGLVDLLVTQGVISPAYELGVKPIIMSSPAANSAFGQLFGEEQMADESTSPPSLSNVFAGAAGHTAGYLNNRDSTIGALLASVLGR